MNSARTDYQAGAAGDASLTAADDRWILKMVRDFPHPPELVWDALTQPEHLKEWAPFDADRDLGRAGAAVLDMVGGEEPQPQAIEVRRAERPAVLEYTWGGDLLRWELVRTDTGTRLTLHHTVTDRRWVSMVAAGWHICLDVAARAMDGAPVGRIAGGDAMAVGWERLRDEYARRLGVPEGEAPPAA